MSKFIKELFTKQLLSEEDGVYRDRSRRFPDSSESDFDGGLDDGTDSSEYGTEGLGFDVSETEEKNFATVYAKVDQIESMMKELVDPKNQENLTRQLANFDRNDSIGKGLLDKLSRPILKSVDSLGSVKNMLDQVASAEPSLQRKIDAITSQNQG